MFYIYHHLGLGDHIICNGMTRHFAEIFDQVTVFCHPHNENNVKYMYRDNNNICTMPIEEHDIENFLKSSYKKYIKVGFENLHQHNNSNFTFDQAFYKLAGLDFSIRFNKFYLDRDLEKENEVLTRLNPNNEKYIFVCDDPDRGFIMDENKFRKDLKIIKNNKNINIFNILKLLENAEEIHTMQTSILDLCNSFVLSKPKIYLHTYIRNYPSFIESKGLNQIRKIY